MTGSTSFDCPETRARLDDWVDRELPPGEDARVRDHLRRCAPCARDFAFEDRLLRGVRAKLAGVAAPPGLAARLRAALAGGPR